MLCGVGMRPHARAVVEDAQGLQGVGGHGFQRLRPKG